MSAGKVVFHSAIQPTKTMQAGGEEQPETLQIQAEGRPGRTLGLSSPGWVVWVLLHLPHLRSARVTDSYDQGEPG